jgi:hypothetical protein
VLWVDGGNVASQIASSCREAKYGQPE